MTAYTANPGYGQHPAYLTNVDAQNSGYDRNRDTEMLDLTGVVGNDIPRRKHFDWCILSVLGYLCCAPLGVCAMYYAMRANHGHDHNIDGYKVHSSSTKAKILTILSIVLGCLAIVGVIIAVICVATSATRRYDDALYSNYHGYTGN